MANLLTHHDPYHLHAFVGLLSLLHYIYRIVLLLLDVPDAGFGAQGWFLDILSFLLFLLPNLTSFIFRHVATKKQDAFTIWKEYRWHAAIWGFRVWLVMVDHLWRKHYAPHPQAVTEEYELPFRIALEFGTMKAMELASQYNDPSVKGKGAALTTIRHMYAGSPVAIFLATYLQFLGRASILVGYPFPQDNITGPMYGLMIVQLNAFNMTLRKKRILTAGTSQLFYSIMLGSSVFALLVRRILQGHQMQLQFFYLASVAYVLRCYVGMDRYSTWLVALITRGIVLQVAAENVVRSG